jgi:riboflavin kinase/FMN adenylyltransferase
MSCEPHPRTFFGVQDGPFRLASPDSKQRVLAGEGVDFVFSPRFDAAFAGLSPEVFAAEVLAGALGVSAVVAGADFRFGRGRAGDMQRLAMLGQDYGFHVHTAPEIAAGGERISSTRIRAAIRSGDLAGAGRLLGAPWLVEVLRGADGRLHLHPSLCRPEAGVFLAAPEGYEEREPVRAEITATGLFLPAMPLAGGEPAFWRLHAVR